MNHHYVNKSLVAEVLNVLRQRRRGYSKSSDEEQAYDERDVREVLRALEQAGYAVIQKGVLQSIKKIFKELGNLAL